MNIIFFVLKLGIIVFVGVATYNVQGNVVVEFDRYGLEMSSSLLIALLLFSGYFTWKVARWLKDFAHWFKIYFLVRKTKGQERALAIFANSQLDFVNTNTHKLNRNRVSLTKIFPREHYLVVFNKVQILILQGDLVEAFQVYQKLLGTPVFDQVSEFFFHTVKHSEKLKNDLLNFHIAKDALQDWCYFLMAGEETNLDQAISHLNLGFSSGKISRDRLLIYKSLLQVKFKGHEGISYLLSAWKKTGSGRLIEGFKTVAKTLPMKSYIKAEKVLRSSKHQNSDIVLLILSIGSELWGISEDIVKKAQLSEQERNRFLAIIEKNKNGTSPRYIGYLEKSI